LLTQTRYDQRAVRARKLYHCDADYTGMAAPEVHEPQAVAECYRLAHGPSQRAGYHCTGNASSAEHPKREPEASRRGPEPGRLERR
jgi:hypothetical protein